MLPIFLIVPIALFYAVLSGLLSVGYAANNDNTATHPPALLLAKTQEALGNPADYWVSEKLDGVRAYWDGKNLWHRSGKPLIAPAWLISALPIGVEVDGELWLGRGRFDALSGLIHRNDSHHPLWQNVHYYWFELPNATGDFTARLEKMRTLLLAHPHPNIHIVQQFRVKDHAALKSKLQAVVRAGGEGLMLHLASAPYETGRSATLIKLKPWLDTEAKVIGHIAGKGRLTGKTGALLMQMPDGKSFRLGSGLTDALRQNPPPIGSTVTYRYTELTQKGLPRYPRFLRIRKD